MLKFISAAVLSIGSMVFVGCQSSSDKSTGAMHTGSANMVCNKCGTTAMKTPVLDDKGHAIAGRYKTMAGSKADVCADCAKMAHEGSMKVGDSMHCSTCDGD